MSASGARTPNGTVIGTTSDVTSGEAIATAIRKHPSQEQPEELLVTLGPGMLEATLRRSTKSHLWHLSTFYLAFVC